MEFPAGGEVAGLSLYEELTARRHDAVRGLGLWTVLDAEDRVAGFTGVQPWERDRGPEGEIEIGRRLGRAHRCRGPATATARLTLERLRAAGVPRVVAVVDARDARSAAVARRLGMRRAASCREPVSQREHHRCRLDP
ncbi:hypothetical protein GCM10018787_37750 [Streptomyces thermodiastaticus]|nr:hypothetical protein GCM10018787_37750 [Streptomyces thermodiastaticus]